MNYKTIYLAGGCFWGIQAYFSKLPGVKKTISGYANGKIVNPTYPQVSSGQTCFAETVLIEYDADKISLKNLLRHYFNIVNPTLLNRQGSDEGTQYRSGIYYTDDDDKKIIEEEIEEEQKQYNAQIVTEIEKLQNFYPAEEYHQKYLDKNPHGYCHIDLTPTKKYEKFKKLSQEEIKNKLNEEQYLITQKKGTEQPFSSPLNNNYKEGIYVDIVSGEPLFSSKEKFDSGSGWPSFTNPIEKTAIYEEYDLSLGMTRKEVKSSIAQSHLGHVFEDGPQGSRRYCINGAALRFIPVEEMEKEGYGDYLYLFY